MSINNQITPSTSGSYTGDSTANRAIPHNLGRIPSIVIIGGTLTGGAMIIYGIYPGEIQYITAGMRAVTGMDNTNFYVGNVANYGETANFAASGYVWAAF